MNSLAVLMASASDVKTIIPTPVYSSKRMKTFTKKETKQPKNKYQRNMRKKHDIQQPKPGY